jgi:DNA-binding XRE family transcriptional regulator
MESRPLREVRRRNLFSIDALAREAKVSTKTIVDIEHGRQSPRLGTMRKISDALKVDPFEVAEFVEAIGEGQRLGELVAA